MGYPIENISTKIPIINVYIVNADSICRHQLCIPCIQLDIIDGFIARRSCLAIIYDEVQSEFVSCSI
jgi:hypothetical protein